MALYSRHPKNSHPPTTRTTNINLPTPTVPPAPYSRSMIERAKANNVMQGTVKDHKTMNRPLSVTTPSPPAYAPSACSRAHRTGPDRLPGMARRRLALDDTTGSANVRNGSKEDAGSDLVDTPPSAHPPASGGSRRDCHSGRVRARCRHDERHRHFPART